MSTKTASKRLERTAKGMPKVQLRFPKMGPRVRTNEYVSHQDLMERMGLNGKPSIIRWREEKNALLQAQNFMARIQKDRSKRFRIWGAKAALRISALCADAYILLAEDEAKDPEKAKILYRNGMEAGRLALDVEMNSDPDADCWNQVTLQHYLRAAYGYASILRDEENYDEAILLWYQLLVVDGTDELRVMRLLVPTLVELNRLDEAELLLQHLDDHASAHMMYSRALCLFKRHGASDIANQVLWKAIQQNMYVIALIRGDKLVTNMASQTYRYGSEEEAQDYVRIALRDKTEHQDAIDWLINFEREKVQKLLVVKTFPGLKLVN